MERQANTSTIVPDAENQLSVLLLQQEQHKERRADFGSQLKGAVYHGGEVRMAATSHIASVDRSPHVGILLLQPT